MEWFDSGTLLKKPIGTVLGFILFVFSFSFFLWHLCPSLYWRDPGEFASIAFTLSVGHPTGSPTYSLIAKLFTFLPWGSLFQKINLVSAVFGALTVYLTFAITILVLEREKTHFARRTFWALFSASSAALLLAVSPTFWLYSQVAKGYPQLTFWILVISYLLLRFREETPGNSPDPRLPARGQSLLFAASFLFGLSLGTYGAMVLYLPAFLGFCFLADRRWYRDFRVLFMGVFFFLLGFSVYLYLPLRSSTHPFLDWGEPRTLSRFLNHLMDAKDTPHNVSFPWATIGSLSWNSFKVLVDQFTPLGIFLSGLGAVTLFRKDRAFFALTFGVALIHWLFFVRLWEMAFLYIPLFLIMALWIGWGVFRLGRAIEKSGGMKVREGFRRGGTYALCGGILLLFLTQWIIHQKSSGKGQYYVPYATGKEMLLSLPPRAVFFTHHSVMLMHGLQSLENLRSDVFVAVIFPLRAPHIYWSLDPFHYPVFDLHKIQGVIRPNSIEFFRKLFAAHSGKYPLYWDLSAEDPWLVPRLRPERLLYRIQEEEVPLAKEVRDRDVKETFRFYQELFKFPGFAEDEEGKRFLKNLIALKGIYYLNRGAIPSALSCTRMAIALMGDDPALHNNLGLLMLSLGRTEEALKSWQRAIELNPMDAPAWLNRAAFYFGKNDLDRALADWEVAARLGGQGVLAHYYRGVAFRDRGESRKALEDLETFVKESYRLQFHLGDDPLFENANKMIREISAELASGKSAGEAGP